MLASQEYAVWDVRQLGFQILHEMPDDPEGEACVAETVVAVDEHCCGGCGHQVLFAAVGVGADGVEAGLAVVELV